MVLGLGFVAVWAASCSDGGAAAKNVGGAGAAGFEDASAGAAGESFVPVVGGGAGDSSGGAVGGEAGSSGGGGDAGSGETEVNCEPLLEVETPVFEVLGDLVPGVNREGYETVPEAMSINGRLVVGSSFIGDEGHAYVWTHETGMKELTTGTGGLISPIDTNCDGSIVMAMNVAGDAFRLAPGKAPLVLLPGTTGAQGVWIQALDATGQVAVGSGGAGDANANAERWVGSNAKGIPLGVRGYAMDVSADGQVIVGVRYVGPDVTDIFRWTEADGVEFLVAATHRMAKVSADGASIIAHHPDGSPFRWRREGVTELACPTDGCTAKLINRDGSVIVMTGPAPEYESLIWTETGGTVSFMALVTESGAMLGPWTNLNIVDMSDNALVFTGMAFGAAEETATYRLQLPRALF